MGKENLYLSLNISAKDFFYLDVYKILTGLVNKYEVDPSRLRLEITENVLMTETKTKLNVLSALRKFGFKIEVDDFGGGYSSLNMLNSNLIDNIKSVSYTHLKRTFYLSRGKRNGYEYYTYDV